MTQYLLILRSDVTKDYSQFSPEDMQRLIEEFGAWGERLESEGHLLGGHKLTDQGGKVMQPGDDGVSVKDGPYVETKEVVGGYYVIKADSYDHAVELCAEHPNFQFGSIEVRELDFLGDRDRLRPIRTALIGRSRSGRWTKIVFLQQHG